MYSLGTALAALGALSFPAGFVTGPGGRGGVPRFPAAPGYMYWGLAGFARSLPGAAQARARAAAREGGKRWI